MESSRYLQINTVTNVNISRLLATMKFLRTTEGKLKRERIIRKMLQVNILEGKLTNNNGMDKFKE
jgi:hypothetical protein